MSSCNRDEDMAAYYEVQRILAEANDEEYPSFLRRARKLTMPTPDPLTIKEVNLATFKSKGKHLFSAVGWDRSYYPDRYHVTHICGAEYTIVFAERDAAEAQGEEAFEDFVAPWYEFQNYHNQAKCNYGRPI